MAGGHNMSRTSLVQSRGPIALIHRLLAQTPEEIHFSLHCTPKNKGSSDLMEKLELTKEILCGCLQVGRILSIFVIITMLCNYSRCQSNETRSPAAIPWSVPPAVDNNAAQWPWSEPPAPKYFNEKCGIRPSVRHRRITGGRNSKFGDWPWQVSIMQRRFFGFPNMHRCGGALVKAFWVITSAHCVHRLAPALLRIRLGEHDFSGTWEPGAFVERAVRRVVVHPKYDASTLENDVAVLEMDTRVPFMEHIAPVCLPPATTDLLIGQSGIITGWGRLRENGALPPILQEVSVRIISNERCEVMFEKAGHIEFIPETFVCTDYISRVPASHCQGDSGGPLQLKGTDGRWFLAGIISWGISCSQANLPAVYVRISRYTTWLKQVMK